MSGPDSTQAANWRFNPNSSPNNSLVNQDSLAEDVARLNIASSDVDRSDQSLDSKSNSVSVDNGNATLESSPHHSRSNSSGAGRLNPQASGSPDVAAPARSQDHSHRSSVNGASSDQPAYPSLSNNAQRGPSKQVNGRNNRGGYTGVGGRGNQFRGPQQIQVGIPQQGLMGSPTGIAYPAGPNGSIPIGTPQQLFDMMVPVDPAISRAQQNGLRGSHQHSGSDPSALEINNGIQSFSPPIFNPGLAGPLSMYPNQYFSNQDAYRADLAAQAQAMLAARLQQQYNSQYSSSTSPTLSPDQTITSPASATSSNGLHSSGPSANNRKLGLYKTELCRSWEEKHTCRYGTKCQFAHGEEELRNVQRHPKYKTEICRTFWVSGSCPYGKRCCFIHTELPHAANGSQGGIPEAGSPPADGRPRSQSNSSDPNEAPKSLLARISTPRDTGSNSNSGTPTPIDTSAATNFPFSRPPTGSLRVDTKSLDTQAYKTQNKSAFPVFPNANGRPVQPAPEPATAKSPIPVTAGPDFGRHTASRIEIVGQNRNGAGTPTNGGGHSYSSSTDETTANHQRASSGTWGANLRGAANYPPSPAAENISSPWTTQELVTGASRQRPW